MAKYKNEAGTVVKPNAESEAAYARNPRWTPVDEPPKKAATRRRTATKKTE